MDTERAEAIVLRNQSVTESSLIVTWFTREFGKLKTLAKGARRPKSPFRGKLDLFYRDEIVFLRSRRSDLHLLHDCFLENPHAKLRDTVEALTVASYVGELVELATAMEDPNPKMFDLLSVALDALETSRGRVSVLIWFELLRQLHQPQRLAVAFGMRAAEIAQQILLRVTAFLLADHHDADAVDRCHPAYDGAVIAEPTIAVQFDEIGGDALEVVEHIRTFRVPR